MSLATLEAFLFASAYFRWFEFNRHKGLSVLYTVSAVGVSLVAFAAIVGLSRMLRRPMKFGISWLLALIFLLALPLGWFVREIERSREQAEIVRLIKGDGGDVLRNKSSSKSRSNSTPSWASTATEWLGEDYFFDVKRATLKTTNHLGRLRTFHRLISLDLTDSSVTDLDVRSIAELHELKFLNLNGTAVTNAGMRELAPLSNLKSLYLMETSVGDEGLKELHRHTQLELVIVNEGRVSDEAAKLFETKCKGAEVLRVKKNKEGERVF
jgi:hypothetical protein